MCRAIALGMIVFASISLPLPSQAQEADGGFTATQALTWACSALGSPCNVTRSALRGDLVEYQTVVRVGPGAHDLIGLHRVVREPVEGRPIRAREAAFLVHGDANSFHSAFEANPEGDPGSLALYLAERDVDVWGIDLRWALVPPETAADPFHPAPAEFEFMKDWDTGTHASDVRTALLLTRMTRALGGAGNARIFLLGISRGAQIAYAVAGAETTLSPVARQVRGLIPLEMAIKTDDETLRLRACSQYQAAQASLQASGLHATSYAFAWLAYSLAASSARDDISPLAGPPYIPVPASLQLTNWEVALVLRAAPFLVDQLKGVVNLVPTFHGYAGSFAYQRILSQLAGRAVFAPTALVFTDEALVLKAPSGKGEYQSRGEQIDLLAMLCDDPAVADVPYDDHLASIRIPVLYLGAAGGWGEYGAQTAARLGSHDLSSYVLDPPNPTCPPVPGFPVEACSFGHGDLLFARDAPELVFQPILDWMREH